MADKDLVVLVADKNMEFTIKGLFDRTQALAIRPIQYDLFVHRERDPGCLRDSHQFLRPFQSTYDHALVLFDREGCGVHDQDRGAIEADTEGRLSASGWQDRAAAIVFDPELEIWVWSSSPHVDTILGWKSQGQSMRTWLVDEGFLSKETDKPTRPKEAMEQVMRRVRKPRSSSLYYQLARKVGLSRCTDPAFLKFRQILQEWFPI